MGVKGAQADGMWVWKRGEWGGVCAAWAKSEGRLRSGWWLESLA